MPDTFTGASDWRLVPPACTAWVVSALIPGRSGRVVLALAILGGLTAATCGWWQHRGHRAARGVPAALALCGLTVAVVAVATWLHVLAAWAGPVPRLAAAGASVRGEVTVTADPLLRPSTFGDGSYAIVRARLSTVTADATTTRVRTPVLVIGPQSWATVTVGDRLSVLGRLAAAEPGGDVAAVLSIRSPPHRVAQPNVLLRFAEHLRSGLRAAVADLPADERALVPALVDGDVSAMPADLAAAFKATGLTHLSAVSGTNLSILLTMLLAVARPLRVRGRARLVVGLATVGFFVLLARPQPSVLRAAVMGLVVVVGAASGYRRGGVPTLAAAVITLVLVDPWLGATIGFVLSVLATAGLLLLAPRLADALARWLPGSVAAALSVPLAAQLTTMPVIAAISASVSLASVPANLLAEPAVGPATVLGVVLTVVGSVLPAVALVLAWLPCLPAWWIATVARVGAALPGHAVAVASGAAVSGATVPGQSTAVAAAGSAGPGASAVGAGSVAAVIAVCVLAIWLGPRVLRSRRATLVVALVLAGLMLVGPTALLGPLRRTVGALAGWPPRDWRIVACDVGQGDGLVLRAGPHAAVVVDSGRDPAPMKACLDDLGVTSVPYLLLTHFDADHVGGTAGVFDGRRVGQVGISAFRPIPTAGQRVLAVAAAAGVPVVTAQTGERMRAGDVSWQTLSAATGSVALQAGPDGPDTAENDASVVWRADVDGITALLTGDLAPGGQAALLALAQRTDPSMLAVDVLKVPHHGSRYQDPAFLAAAHARVALVSVGIDNDYGHPAAATLDWLRGDGDAIWRTDLDGALAVAGSHQHLRVVSRRHTRLSDPRAAAPRAAGSEAATGAYRLSARHGRVGADERNRADRAAGAGDRARGVHRRAHPPHAGGGGAGRGPPDRGDRAHRRRVVRPGAVRSARALVVRWYPRGGAR